MVTKRFTLRLGTDNMITCMDYKLKGLRPTDRTNKTGSEVAEKDCWTDN